MVFLGKLRNLRKLVKEKKVVGSIEGAKKGRTNECT